MWWIALAGATMLLGMYAVHDALGGGARATLYALGYAVALVAWLAWVLLVASDETRLCRRSWRVVAAVYWVWSLAMFGAAVAAFVALGDTKWLLTWTVAAAGTLGAVAAWLAEHRGPVA